MIGPMIAMPRLTRVAVQGRARDRQATPTFEATQTLGSR
jgi:hypothetical protein